MGKSTINGHFPVRYVCLPEGKESWGPYQQQSQHPGSCLRSHPVGTSINWWIMTKFDERMMSWHWNNVFLSDGIGWNVIKSKSHERWRNTYMIPKYVNTQYAQCLHAYKYSMNPDRIECIQIVRLDIPSRNWTLLLNVAIHSEFSHEMHGDFPQLFWHNQRVDLPRKCRVLSPGGTPCHHGFSYKLWFLRLHSLTWPIYKTVDLQNRGL